MSLPRTAYVTLWFPKPSETFVVSEVAALRQAGLPVSVHSLYGPLKNANAMLLADVPVERLGLAALPRILLAFLASLAQRPWRTLSLVGLTLLSPGGGFEKYGENLLAVFCGFRLARRFRQLGIEHVHATWANGSATAAWCAASLLGIPFSFSARAGDVHPPDGLLARKLRLAAFARVDSAYNLPHLRALVPGSPDTVRLVYNARTLAPAAEAPVPMGRPLQLLAAGRFVETKGFQHLVEALALLRAEGLDARLTLAGDGPWRARLKAAVERLGLSDYVQFPGFIPHEGMPALLRAADMLVMPSIRRPNGDSDGLPTVIVEALLHRLPVVATNVASIPDVVRHGETGLLAPEGDPAALAQAIARMAADRGAALDMAARGRELALHLFDPTACGAALLGLIAGEKSQGGQGDGPCAA